MCLNELCSVDDYLLLECAAACSSAVRPAVLGTLRLFLSAPRPASASPGPASPETICNNKEPGVSGETQSLNYNITSNYGVAAAPIANGFPWEQVVSCSSRTVPLGKKQAP